MGFLMKLVVIGALIYGAWQLFQKKAVKSHGTHGGPPTEPPIDNQEPE